MDLELLDRLEDRVDVCVTTVRDLRTENDGLRREIQELERRVGDLTRELSAKAESANGADEWRTRYGTLEKKLERVRGRLEGMVEKIKTLEG